MTYYLKGGGKYRSPVRVQVQACAVTIAYPPNAL